ncbi:MAG: hypothetical protein DWQ36_14960 [Acidobacteria bacterium]|nr:MAG: hypothetical protein DWQ30_00060 [Acidobacteriota bacterium]REK06191.1 MAG: hypothetical protein DWQ36_14960 [Acidobacteriota bacterium]
MEFRNRTSGGDLGAPTVRRRGPVWLRASVATVLLAGSAVTAWAGPQAAPQSLRVAPHGPCKIAGSWLATSPAFLPELGDQTLLAIATITPIDPTCRRFAFELVPVNPELSFAGIFPEATVPPGLFGTLVREAGGYRLFATAPSPEPPPPGLPIRGRVLYFWTYDATIDCADASCETFDLLGVVSLFSSIDDPEREVPELGLFGVPDQDRDDDGFADDGEVPLLQAPFPFHGRRIGAR